MQGQIDPTYADIIKSVSSIIFLSTPHRGTSLAEILNRILQVSFVTNPMQFIAELAAGSQTLQKLNEQFRHVASKLQIVSFYETRPTSLKKISIVCNIVRGEHQTGKSLTVAHVDGPREGLVRIGLPWRNIEAS